MTSELDILTLPLIGSRLIEASAGTGKTYTIAALYLRLVLGHGGEAGFGRPLAPPDILVVTYTDAATQELRDRIRSRLCEAARYFREGLENEPDDVLVRLRNETPEGEWPAQGRRLELAAEWMDEAAVSTIHSWCRRMLREHAFDSGSLFAQELEADHGELKAEVLRDYWRVHCYPLAGEALAWVLAQWGTPEALGKRLVDEPEESTGAGPLGPLGQLFDGIRESRTTALAGHKSDWRKWLPEVRAILEEGAAKKAFNGNKIRAASLQNWLASLEAWAGDGDAVELDLGTGWNRLSAEGLGDAWKGDPPTHAAFDAVPGLRRTLAELPGFERDIVRHASLWVRRRFEAEKARRAEMDFDDLLSRLEAALRSPSGSRLAEALRRQFPVVLIDEFQDTDPIQYGIFSRIYASDSVSSRPRQGMDTWENRKSRAVESFSLAPLAGRGSTLTDPQPSRMQSAVEVCGCPCPEGEGNREIGLFMIGDPKQAIYAFRNADIQTYLQAKRATEGRHHTLLTNFRSTGSMVAAVNRVFAHAEAREQGAFLFRRNAEDPIPFHPVKARGRKDCLVIRGVRQPALTLWHPENQIEPMGRSEYQATLAAATACEIVRLLNLGQAGLCGFEEEGQDFRPLLPGHLAILVRTGRQAAAVRKELSRRRVRSVYLSDRDSVLRSVEAGEVLSLLLACAEPDEERLLRAALAGRLLDLSLAELDRLGRDEEAWESRVLQFRGYRALWQSQGVLPMLRRLFHDFRLPSRLGGREGGERSRTNLLHLAELLQAWSGELEGEQALIRRLAESMTEESGEDERILRLESDENLVKVVTIHKSKGLEYPLVFIPFPCPCRPVTKDDGVARFHGPDGRRRVVVAPDEEQVAAADRERLEEDVRLMYVALTRARHAAWLGVADVKTGNSKASDLHRSALGQLLTGGTPLAASSELPSWLAAMKGASSDIVLAGLPEIGPEPLEADEVRSADFSARRMGRRAADEHWWIASYSALGIEEGVPARPVPEPESLLDQKVLEAAAEADGEAALPAVADIHGFPRGAAPGTFLHGLLEWAAGEGFSPQEDRLRRVVARQCARRGCEEWAEPLSAWLMALLETPLPAGGEAPVLSRTLGSQAEMEFWFGSRRVDARKLDALVTRHTLAGRPRPPLEPNRLNGMVKGYMDLVFQWDGRYFVADYKSNWLGAGDTAYTLEAMAAAVLEKRYDLQYALYLLALHRQLKARLPGYDYDAHMGGAVYLFLRGIRAPSRGVHFERPDRQLIEDLDRLFAGEGA